MHTVFNGIENSKPTKASCFIEEKSALRCDALNSFTSSFMSRVQMFSSDLLKSSIGTNRELHDLFLHDPLARSQRSRQDTTRRFLPERNLEELQDFVVVLQAYLAHLIAVYP